MGKEIEILMSVNLPVQVRMTIEVSDDFDPSDPDPNKYKIVHVAEGSTAYVSGVGEVEQALHEDDYEEVDRLVIEALKKQNNQAKKRRGRK